MCRIALLPQDIILKRTDDVVKFVKYLELRQGGDGNGFGWYYKNEPVVLKGFEDLAELTEKVKEELEEKPSDSGYVLFHTRLASAGSKEIYNLHPHVSFDKNIMLIHNGHFSNYLKYKDEAMKLIKDLYVVKKKVFFVDRLLNKKISYTEELDLNPSDTLVMTQILAKKVKEEGIEQGLKFLENEINFDAVIFQTRDSQNYVVTGKPLEVGYLDGKIVIASEGLNMLGVEKAKTLDDAIAKIVDDKLEIVKKIERKFYWYGHSILSDTSLSFSFAEKKKETHKKKRTDEDRERFVHYDY